jgi:hypothetical protein
MGIIKRFFTSRFFITIFCPVLCGIVFILTKDVTINGQEAQLWQLFALGYAWGAIIEHVFLIVTAIVLDLF